MNIYRLKAKIITFFCCLLLSQTVVFAQNAKKISINFDTVFYYKRENLKIGERLAYWIK